MLFVLSPVQDTVSSTWNVWEDFSKNTYKEFKRFGFQRKNEQTCCVAMWGDTLKSACHPKNLYWFSYVSMIAFMCVKLPYCIVFIDVCVCLWVYVMNVWACLCVCSCWSPERENVHNLELQRNSTLTVHIPPHHDWKGQRAPIAMARGLCSNNSGILGWNSEKRGQGGGEVGGGMVSIHTEEERRGGGGCQGSGVCVEGLREYAWSYPHQIKSIFQRGNGGLLWSSNSCYLVGLLPCSFWKMLVYLRGVFSSLSGAMFLDPHWPF